MSKRAKVAERPATDIREFFKDVEIRDDKLRVKLNRAQTLVLNADYTPISILPLEPLGWKDAIRNVFLEKCIVIEEYEDVFLRSANSVFNIPSIIVNKVYQKHTRVVTFTRRNVFMRDGFTCQYCGHKFAPVDLTYDHVVPRKLGGKTEWDNIVTSCNPCNSSKAHTPLGKWVSPLGLKRPLTVPVKPTYGALENRFKEQPLIIPDLRWNTYLQWKGPLWVHDPVTGENIQVQGADEETTEELGF